jgi:molecular chaperone DnaK (HSP70)
MADLSLADGWTQQLSKTTGKHYYVHTSTGKRQWHIPAKIIEEARGKIKTYYDDLYRNPQVKVNVYESSKNFLKFIKRAIFDEFVVDLEMDVSCECKYVVLDAGCGKGEDIDAWKKLIN